MPVTQFLQHTADLSQSLSCGQRWTPLIALATEHTTEGARERLPCLLLLVQIMAESLTFTACTERRVHALGCCVGIVGR